MKSSFLPKYEQKIVKISALTKGQLISKCIFSVFNFFQKTTINWRKCPIVMKYILPTQQYIILDPLQELTLKQLSSPLD